MTFPFKEGSTAVKYGIEEIQKYWMDQAVEHGQSPAASWSDLWAIELEIKAIADRLDDGDSVLDVGCANGYSTVRYAMLRDVRIQGIDYIPQMIEQARERVEAISKSLRGQVDFSVGDVTALSLTNGSYNKVISTRVIINLESWEKQLLGLKECARVLKPGGIFLLSEATLQGWSNLNRFRGEWHLPEISKPPFNLYLDEDQVIEALRPDLELVELVNFASTYFVGTRLFKPLLIKALGLSIDVANPNMEWNRWCAQLPAAGDYGTQKLFVFRKLC
jgi:SAM-dependent methyltransferase